MSSRAGFPVTKVRQIAGTARGVGHGGELALDRLAFRIGRVEPPGERGEVRLPVVIRLLLLLGHGPLGHVLLLGHPVPVERPVSEASPGGGAVRVEERDGGQVSDRLGLQPAMLAPIGELHLSGARVGRPVAPGVVLVQGSGLIGVRPDARGDRIRLQPLVAVADQAVQTPRGEVHGIGLRGEAERLGRPGHLPGRLVLRRLAPPRVRAARGEGRPVEERAGPVELRRPVGSGGRQTRTQQEGGDHRRGSHMYFIRCR